jgi:hypothetical protein
VQIKLAAVVLFTPCLPRIFSVEWFCWDAGNHAWCPVTGELSGAQQKKLFATESMIVWLDDHLPSFQEPRA